MAGKQKTPPPVTSSFKTEEGTSTVDQGGYTVDKDPEIVAEAESDPEIVAEAESSIGWAVAIGVAALVAWIVAPALFPILLLAAAVLAVVSIAKVVAAVVDYATGKLFTDPSNPNPPLLRLAKKAQSVVWLLVLLLAAAWYFKRQRGKR